MTYPQYRKALLIAVFFFLPSCALLHSTLTEPVNQDGVAISSIGFVKISRPNDFIQTYLKSDVDAKIESHSSLTIYIEGDGAAWLGRSIPPSNPTPKQSLGAFLASQDPSATLAYLGRPCQYLDAEKLAHCPSKFWTDGRFSEEVIALSNQAIDRLLQKLQILSNSKVLSKKINLVGYSGGGALATLIASSRTDVRCLVTIAAPLDTQAWTQLQQIAPLHSSLNPAAPSKNLLTIKQSHWFGVKDLIVPPASLGNYLANNGSTQTQIQTLSTANHFQPWVEEWPKIMSKTCLKSP